MEIAELLVGGAHRASWSLVWQSMQSHFEPMQSQLCTYTWCQLIAISYEVKVMYAVGQKNRVTLFSIKKLAFLGRFLHFLYHGNRNEYSTRPHGLVTS